MISYNLFDLGLGLDLGLDLGLITHISKSSSKLKYNRAIRISICLYVDSNSA